MNDIATGANARPRVRPADARFSSGPCRKHPGWDISALNTDHLGRSHRAANPKAHLKSAIDRSAALLNLPSDWKLGIVPASDTGAFEMAMWSLLGSKNVDAFVWESFSSDWAKDLGELALPGLNIFNADYGMLPTLRLASAQNDIVFVFNGTTSGVRVPNLDWISADREGIVLCDATSAAYAMPIDYDKVDVLTWSWQKSLGGEGAHGMLALSPRAVERLESEKQPRALPKIFTLTKKQALIDGIFSGATINTPSMLAVADLHSALDWADSIGGLKALHARSSANFKAMDAWVSNSQRVSWLANDATTRSSTSLCLQIIATAFQELSLDKQQAAVKTMVGWLAEEGVALDIANYRSAPPGFRVWGGATVDASDIEALTAWLDWAYIRFESTELN
ncbi:MAG: phosphoserine transaminase [Granulosicoccaceae bacterium]